MSLLSISCESRRLTNALWTSIWLKDVSQILEKTHNQCYYHGFDISADQFPEKPGSIQFSVHDITLPFPKEHWNRYDMVHVRLLVAALEESEYKTAVLNLSAILSMYLSLISSMGQH